MTCHIAAGRSRFGEELRTVDNEEDRQHATCQNRNGNGAMDPLGRLTPLGPPRGRNRCRRYFVAIKIFRFITVHPDSLSSQPRWEGHGPFSVVSASHPSKFQYVGQRE